MKLALAIALAILFAMPQAALARTEKKVGWSAEKVWPAAVRFLRVDMKLKLVEKDADAGYVMFELKEEGKTFSGALELIPSDDGVRLVMQISDRPSYLEQMMLDKLERKLRLELGTPPPRPAPEPEPEPSPPSE